ncbi:glycoside hydrolase superfamily [Paraphysoderma sedebokerense]|nr:glycoside hydrolase superfamily [Paraphysoderma sedebokerense]
MDRNVYYGVYVDFWNDTPENYTKGLGRTPSVFGNFLKINQTFDPTEMRNNIKTIVSIANNRSRNGVVESIPPMYLLTLDPLTYDVPDETFQLIANECRDANRLNVSVLIRYAHEFNGPWYPWGAQPDRFIETWKRLYKAVKAASPDTQLIYSPNIYFHPINGTTYSDYWPGDDFVDVVGLSFYHFGNGYPFINEEAYPDKFERGLLGRVLDFDCDPRLNYYQHFAIKTKKPFIISETSAPLYTDRSKNPVDLSELNQKRSWWKQVYSAATFDKFPRLKMVLWFEYTKRENFGAESNHRVITNSDAVIRDTFKNDLPIDRLIFNEDRVIWNDFKSEVERLKTFNDPDVNIAFDNNFLCKVIGTAPIQTVLWTTVAIGIVILLAALACCVFCWRRRRRRKAM